ncbi:MAG: response regulator [Thermodesulfobacteriota bacterium]|nr:response regulator [Thermodesulfobacteriota bacterium]
MGEDTILIVDDEEGIINALRRVLMDDGYHILSALSGQEGLVKLKGNKVDLVISDQQMPVMTGIEFLKKVRVAYPNILTIMLTGHADIDAAIEAINEAGVYKFILKPWNDADIRLTIKRALELRHLVVERDSLLEQVKAQEMALKRLEEDYPGITKVDTDKDGFIVI